MVEKFDFETEKGTDYTVKVDSDSVSLVLDDKEVCKKGLRDFRARWTFYLNKKFTGVIMKDEDYKQVKESVKVLVAVADEKKKKDAEKGEITVRRNKNWGNVVDGFVRFDKRESKIFEELLKGKWEPRDPNTLDECVADVVLGGKDEIKTTVYKVLEKAEQELKDLYETAAGVVEDKERKKAENVKKGKEIREKMKKIVVAFEDKNDFNNRKVTIRLDGKKYTKKVKRTDISYGEVRGGDWISQTSYVIEGVKTEFGELPAAVRRYFNNW